MECDLMRIEAFLNKESCSGDVPIAKCIDNLQLSSDEQALIEHISICQSCEKYMKETIYLNSVLNSYNDIQIDDNLLQTLNLIPNTTKKPFSLFNLMPKELALTAASVLFALFLGGFFSMQALNLQQEIHISEQDIFEEINLVSLLDM